MERKALPYAAIIFDFDGTLVDTLADIRSAVNAAMRASSLPDKDEEWVRNNVGQGAGYLMGQALGPEATAEAKAAALGCFVDHYDRHPVEFSVPYPGAVAFLEAAQARELRLAVLSNKPSAILHRVVSLLGMSKYFAHLWGGDSFPERKPSPAGVLHFLQATRLSNRRVLFVGDSAADQACAREAGTPFAFHTGGYGQLESLPQRPDLLFDGYFELGGLIGLDPTPAPR